MGNGSHCDHRQNCILVFYMLPKFNVLIFACNFSDRSQGCECLPVMLSNSHDGKEHKVVDNVY